MGLALVGFIRRSKYFRVSDEVLKVECLKRLYRVGLGLSNENILFKDEVPMRLYPQMSPRLVQTTKKASVVAPGNNF
jgi:hypothetical protein